MTSKTVLVSGASAGFGAAIATRFAENGWRVIAFARRAERLAQLVERFGKNRVHTAAFDIRDEAAMRAALDALPESFRNIDVLVNNADLAQWKQMIDTNVTALVTLTRLLLPGLIERRGAIVNIGSISGTYPYTGGNKAFVTQFSLGLRCDLHGSGVRVTSVEPGMAETEFTLVRTGGDREASEKLYKGAHPITGQDIADTVWWIANLPPHLNVNRIEMMPVSQSPAGLQVARDQ